MNSTAVRHAGTLKTLIYHRAYALEWFRIPNLNMPNKFEANGDIHLSSTQYRIT